MVDNREIEVVYEKFFKVYEKWFPHSYPTRESKKTVEKIIKKWYNTKWDYTQELDTRNSNYKKIEDYAGDIEFIFETYDENFIVDLTHIFMWHKNNRLF